MFDFAEKSNLHGNLTDSIKMVINSHKVLSVKTLLLTSFLNNDVESSFLINFFNVNFVNRVLNDLLIILIGINDDAENRMVFNHYYKNCDYFINHLLSLMNLILKLSENINILYK